jgi:hypothetical protein
MARLAPEEVRTGSVAAVALAAMVVLAHPGGRAKVPAQHGSGDIRALDGSACNLRHPLWGQASMPYARVAAL